MPKANGADVTLDGHDFLLARDASGKPLLSHGFRPKLATKFSTGQDAGGGLLSQYSVPYSFDDWSGGEGAVFFIKDRETVYSEGTANGRDQGKLKGPPEFDESSISPDVFTTGGHENHLFAVNAGSYLVTLSDEDNWYTLDGTTWTKSEGGAANDHYTTAVVGDSRYAWYAIYDGTDRRIHRFDTQDITAGAMDDERVSDDDTSVHPYVGLALLGPFLVIMGEGGTIFDVDITDTSIWPLNPADFEEIFKIGLDLGEAEAAGMFSTDSAVYFFVSMIGVTQVFAATVETTTWTVTPVATNLFPGFTTRAACYHMGIAWFAGDYTGLDTARAGLIGVPVFTPTALFQATEIRTDQTFNTYNYEVADIKPGIGATLLIGMKSGEVFVYDIGKQAYSLLDTHPQAADGDLHSVATYRDQRLAFTRDTGSSAYDVASWHHDKDASTLSGFTVMPGSTLAMPEAAKTILGFHVLFKPFTGSETLLIEYKVDEATGFTSIVQNAGVTIDNTIAGSNLGYCFVPLSEDSASSISGRSERMKVTVNNGFELFTITADNTVLDYEEIWELYLDLADEQAEFRLTDRQSGGAILDKLLWKLSTGIIPNRKVFELVDYTHMPDPDGDEAPTISVVFESGQDVILAADDLQAPSQFHLILRKAGQ